MPEVFKSPYGWPVRYDIHAVRQNCVSGHSLCKRIFRSEWRVQNDVDRSPSRAMLHPQPSAAMQRFTDLAFSRIIGKDEGASLRIRRFVTQI
jgi:hypothetical protein